MQETIKYRNLIAQVLLTVVTFGLYIIYWFYVTSREMERYLKREEPVFLWTILFLLPPLAFYSYYKQGELFEKISPDINRWLTFVLWIVFAPAVWIIIQNKLNRLAVEQPVLEG